MEETMGEQKPVIRRGGPNIWKLIAIVLLVLVVIGGAYFAGSQRNNIAIAPSPTPAVSQTPTTSISGSPSEAPSPSKTPSKSVEAGQGSIGVFIPYRISVPQDWNFAKSGTKDVLDILTITRGAYKIEIRQAGGEGLKCIYDKEPDQDFSQRYKTFVEFKSLDEEFRRSGDDNGTAWTLCHKTNSGWGFPSIYGYISYSNPTNPNPDILKEMDSIISTIVKQ